MELEGKTLVTTSGLKYIITEVKDSFCTLRGLSAGDPIYTNYRILTIEKYLKNGDWTLEETQQSNFNIWN